MAKMTSKGQVTIPQSVREALGLEPGDRISFQVVGEGARIHKQGSLAELRGTVPVPSDLRGKSWEEIRAVTARRRAADWDEKARRLAD